MYLEYPKKKNICWSIKMGNKPNSLPRTVEVFVCLSLLFKSQLETSVP